MHSLLIVKNNKLVVDEYFNGSHKNDVHTQQSIAKSVTALLTGIAMDREDIHVSDGVIDFFQTKYPVIDHVDEFKNDLTWADLLSMRTGMAWNENPYEGSPLQTLNQSSGDWVKFVLDQPMERAPGTYFRYNSGAAILLGGMIRESAEISTDDFAREFLFNKMGVETTRWYRSPYDQLPHTGGGLLLKARDMAKIGQLVLNEGEWDGTQVVPKAWIDQIKIRFTQTNRGYYSAWYSYMWWILPYEKNNVNSPTSDDMITASGAGGQWIFIIPKHQLVVVTTGGTQNGEQELAPVDFLYSSILPALNK
jgi:CubicO group peptidase (beta-lactamase class C family)